jgi:hypothetical protein
MAEDTPLWHRQEYDDNESWAAFQVYRDQVPPRRQRAVHGAATAKVHQWFMRNHWDARVKAMDAHLERIRDAEREAVFRESSRDVAAKHMGMLATARDLVERELAEYLRKPAGTFRPADLAKFLEVTIRYDRLVRGEATETVANLDLRGFTDKELDQFEELNRRALEAGKGASPAAGDGDPTLQ